MDVVVRLRSQKRIKSPLSFNGKKTIEEKTKELMSVILISSIILNMTYVLGLYRPSFLSLSSKRVVRKYKILI